MTNLSREEQVWLIVYQAASKQNFWADALLDADEILKLFKLRFPVSTLPQESSVSELSQGLGCRNWKYVRHGRYEIREGRIQKLLQCIRTKTMNLPEDVNKQKEGQ